MVLYMYIILVFFSLIRKFTKTDFLSLTLLHEMVVLVMSLNLKKDFRCGTILVTLSMSLLIVVSQIKIQSTLNCCYDNLSISYLYFT